MRASYLLMGAAMSLIAEDAWWKIKPTSDWTADDARTILSNSPWGKTVRATISPLQTEDQRREGGKMGQEHGIGFDGLPDDRPRATVPKRLIDLVKPENTPAPTNQSLTLQLRWERALPIRVAEMKAGLIEPPSLDDEGYSLAVYGIPASHVHGDPRASGEQFKRAALLKREGKKDVRAASVEVFEGENGLVIVYQFPLSAEITKNDRRMEFDAQIGRIHITQSFDVEEMRFLGKLEI